MKTWTKEEALLALKGLAEQADSLRSSKAYSSEHTIWVTKCLETFEEVFGPASRYYRSFAGLRWRRTDSYVLQDYGNIEEAKAAIHHKAYIRDLGIAKGLLLRAIEYLEERELGDIYDAKDTEPEASLILKVLHLAERQLRKVIRTQPSREVEVQDAFEDLLIGAAILYSRESERIEYSSKTYVPDFTLPKIRLAVEVKLCGQKEREKALIEEINDDILAYQTKYVNLLFIVYDIGCIRDIDRFIGSFEEKENVTVRVIKH